jgi:hypothetical protein
VNNVLYDVWWQKMRCSCLAAHHQNGGFTTGAGTLDNLQRLNQYLSPESVDLHRPPNVSAEEEKACRVWRVLNLLNATRMGYQGMNLGGSEMDQAVQQYRDQLQPQYNGSLVARVDDKWDWNFVQTDLEALWRNERYWFKAIWDDLSRRRKVTNRKREGDLSHRGELVRFLDMMEQVGGLGGAQL